MSCVLCVCLHFCLCPSSHGPSPCLSVSVTISVLLTLFFQWSQFLPGTSSTQAIRLHVHPLYLMIPGTVSCSYAFMLPVSTPPNSIAFSTGHLLVKDMVSVGLPSSGPAGGGWVMARYSQHCPSVHPHMTLPTETVIIIIIILPSSSPFSLLPSPPSFSPLLPSSSSSIFLFLYTSGSQPS